MRTAAGGSPGSSRGSGRGRTGRRERRRSDPAPGRSGAIGPGGFPGCPGARHPPAASSGWAGGAKRREMGRVPSIRTGSRWTRPSGLRVVLAVGGIVVMVVFVLVVVAVKVREGVGQRFGEVAEDIGRVVVADDLVGAGEIVPALFALRDHPSLEAPDAEREVLVVVVDDDKRADLPEQARGRVLEALDESALGALAALLEVEGEVVQGGCGGGLVGGGLDGRLTGSPRIGRAGIWIGGARLRAVGVADRRRPEISSHVGVLGIGEGLEDVGRVVELDELRGRLDDLGLADPLALRVVVDAAAAAERSIRRDREEVLVLVDEGQAAQHPDPVGVGLHEALELLPRAYEEIRALDGGLTGHVG